MTTTKPLGHDFDPKPWDSERCRVLIAQDEHCSEYWQAHLPLSAHLLVEEAAPAPDPYTAGYRAGLEAAARCMESRKVTASDFYAAAIRSLPAPPQANEA